MCFCQPHTCLGSFKFLHEMIETFLHLNKMLPKICRDKLLQNDESEKTVLHISPRTPKQNIVWVVLEEFGFSKKYIVKLLEGVDFTVVLEHGGWVSYRVSNKWHYLQSASTPSFDHTIKIPKYSLMLCHHKTRCNCKSINQTLMWHHMIPPV